MIASKNQVTVADIQTKSRNQVGILFLSFNQSLIGFFHQFGSISNINIYTNYLKSTKNKPLRSHLGKGGDPGTRANAGGGPEVWGVGVQINGEGCRSTGEG